MPPAGKKFAYDDSKDFLEDLIIADEEVQSSLNNNENDIKAKQEEKASSPPKSLSASPSSSSDTGPEPGPRISTQAEATANKPNFTNDVPPQKQLEKSSTLSKDQQQEQQPDDHQNSKKSDKTKDDIVGSSYSSPKCSHVPAEENFQGSGSLSKHSCTNSGTVTSAVQDYRASVANQHRAQDMREDCNRESSSSPSANKSEKKKQKNSFKPKHNERNATPTPPSSPRKRICPPPDIPVGIMLPVVYVSGDSLTDFSVMTLKNRKFFNKMQQLLQNYPKEQSDQMEIGQWCLLKDGNNTWYRGIVTQTLNSANYVVYLVDVGKTASVNTRELWKLGREQRNLRIRPLAIRMCVHNIKFVWKKEEMEAHDLFQKYIRWKPLKILITHEVFGSNDYYRYAGKLMMEHRNEWHDVVDYLQNLRIGRKLSEPEIVSDCKLIPLKTASSVFSISTLMTRREYLGFITNVISLNEFYFTTKEMIQKKTTIEERLNSRDMATKLEGKRVKYLDSLISQRQYAIREEGSQLKFARVTVLEVTEANDDDGPISVIVFGLDSGVIKKVFLENLMILPPELTSPSTVFKCSLPVKPEPAEGEMQANAIAKLRERVGHPVHAVPLLFVSQTTATDSDCATLVELYFKEDEVKDKNYDYGFTTKLLKLGFQFSK